MSHYKITKIIEFCYGHRLLNYVGKCQHLHGHNAVLEVDVESDKDQLDSRGMVVDFKLITEVVKTWVDEHLDHRLLLCKDDPLVPILTEMNELHYVMDANPTAENIAQHIFQLAHQKGWHISEVRLWETPSSCAVYRG